MQNLDAIRRHRRALTAGALYVLSATEGPIPADPLITAVAADIDALLARVAALERALNHATLVIENYEQDIRDSAWTGVDLAAVGFCQGIIYTSALRIIDDLAQD